MSSRWDRGRYRDPAKLMIDPSALGIVQEIKDYQMPTPIDSPSSSGREHLEEALKEGKDQRVPIIASDAVKHSNCIPRDQLEAIIRQAQVDRPFHFDTHDDTVWYQALGKLQESIEKKWGKYVPE